MSHKQTGPIAPFRPHRGRMDVTMSPGEGGRGVFEASDIREWRGHNVIDGEGHKIGTLESIYVDTGTDQPSFATVTIGAPMRHRLVFVPLAGASVGPSYLRVTHPRSQVRSGPSIDTDGELPASNEPAVFDHYHLNYVPGASGERRLARR
jgi:hypothetical protein